MEQLAQAARGNSPLGVNEFLRNVEELKGMGMQPSASSTCCAGGTR